MCVRVQDWQSASKQKFLFCCFYHLHLFSITLWEFLLCFSYFFPLYHVCSLSFAFFNSLTWIFLWAKKEPHKVAKYITVFSSIEYLLFFLTKKNYRMEKCLVYLLKICFFVSITLLYLVWYSMYSLFLDVSIYFCLFSGWFEQSIFCCIMWIRKI